MNEASTINPQVELLPLLQETARGNQSAFEQLYKSTSAKMYAVAMRLLRHPESADDVMQEAYVKIWHNASEYLSERGAVLTWMISILRYRAIDKLRKNKRDHLHDDTDDHQDQLIDDKEDLLKFMQQAGDAKVLNGCLEELVDTQRQSIALAFYDGLTHEELSQHYGAPLGTVKSWVRRGLILLRRCLER